MLLAEKHKHLPTMQFWNVLPTVLKESPVTRRLVAQKHDSVKLKPREKVNKAFCAKRR